MKWYIPCLSEGKKPKRPETNHFEEQGASISKITSQTKLKTSEVDEPQGPAENNIFLDALTQVLGNVNPESQELIRKGNEEMLKSFGKKADVDKPFQLLTEVSSIESVITAFTKLAVFLNGAKEKGGVSDELFGLWQGDRCASYV